MLSRSTMSEEPPGDNSPDPKENLRNLLGMLGEALESQQNADPLEGYSDEDKAKFKEISDRIMDRTKDLERACFLAGITCAARVNHMIKVDTFGADSVYDENTCMVHGVFENVCLSNMLASQAFNPECDEELYAEKQDRPEGRDASFIALIWPVKKEANVTFDGIFAPPQGEEEKVGIVESFVDDLLLEIYKVDNRQRAAHAADHYHYDLELYARKEFSRDFVLGDAAFRIPALPLEQASGLDFIASLEFMDENPESGG